MHKPHIRNIAFSSRSHTPFVEELFSTQENLLHSVHTYVLRYVKIKMLKHVEMAMPNIRDTCMSVGDDGMKES